MKARLAALLALGLALGVGIPLMIGGTEVFGLLRRVPPATIALLLGIIVVVWHLSAGRLRLLAGGAGVTLGQGRAFAIVLATEFTVCLTPAGSGGYVTYAWLLNRHGLARARGVALCVADHFIDALFFFSALCVLMIHWMWVPHRLHLGWQFAGLGALLLVLMASLWLFVEHERHVFRSTGKLLRALGVGPRWRRRIARGALEFRHSLKLVREFPRWRLAVIFLLCALQWILRYSVLFFAVKAVGGYIAWSYAFLVQMLSLTVGQASFLPGGSGVAEASSTLLLTQQMSAATAAASILLWRFATYYWYIIAGAPFFAALAGRPIWRLATRGSK